MAGKSTVMRQAALIVLMAQMGCFVPARRARVGLVDRIFTRVGASDDLARGRSTFMVEMTETAAILHNATRRSLVMLDEIGRGTSTFDGLSIAWAVAEHLHDEVGAGRSSPPTTTSCRTWPGSGRAVKQPDGGGPRGRGAGGLPAQAGRRAGPRAATASRWPGWPGCRRRCWPGRARSCSNLEAMEVDERGHAALAHGRRRRAEPVAQLGLFASPDPAAAELQRALAALDLDALRPIDALNLLAGWKQKHGQ